MRGKFILAFAFLTGISITGSLAAHAQDQQAQAQRPQAPAARPSDRQTDMGFSVYNAFTAPSTGNGVSQTPSDALGGMFELRHIQRPLIGYELTFSYNAADEKFAPTPVPSCGFQCQNPPQDLASKGYLVGLDWVFSKQYGNLRPFAVGGLGFFIDEPNNSVYPINDIVRITYIYGGGLDYSLSRHFGLRAQYRGNIYRAPNLSVMFASTGKFTHMNEPMGGIFYRF